MPTRDEDAFLQMVRDNDARLRRICRVYADDAGERDDLYQEVLTQLWRSFPSFDGSAEPGTWLYRVALNTALSHRRKEATRSEATLDDENPLWGADPPGPDDRLEAKDRRERLYAAIDQLDDIDTALVMMYLDETPYREMAEVLGISESHVGVKLHRAKKKLQALLQESPRETPQTPTTDC
jgi:RNA polymerase sigma-70 factor (ECF subfamily)